jgi:hypothetical protein
MAKILKTKSHDTKDKNKKRKKSVKKLEEDAKKFVKVKPHLHVKGDDSKDDKIADENASLFKKRLKKIRKVKKTNNYDEKFNAAVLKSLLDMVLDLVPIAEQNYRRFRSDRPAYALNTYVNQGREIINDLRAIEDFQDRADKIKQIVRLHFTKMLENLVDELHRLRSNLLQSLHVDDPTTQKAVAEALQSMLKSHSSFSNESLKAIGDKLDAYLVKET